ncbi:MAG: TPM domain-containing protein, partial [Acidimicrobiia bacterium]|nr:TPM domain-containing protein [Acidimicrobiia bacterium]
GLGDAWGIGDPERDDGIIVVVDLDSRITTVQHGPGLNEVPRSFDSISAVGNSFFASGDFDGGLLAIIGSLDEALAAFEAGETTSSGGVRDVLDGYTPDGTSTESGDGPNLAIVGGVVGTFLLGGLGVTGVAVRTQRRTRTRRIRREYVDGELSRLDVGGHELPLLRDFLLNVEVATTDAPTIDVRKALTDVAEVRRPDSEAAVEAAYHHRLVNLVDRARMVEAAEIPLELRVTDEREVLEGGVQAAAREALEIDLSDDPTFEVRREELSRLVDSLRPYRVAEARSRVAATVDQRLVETGVGYVLLTDLGERFLKAAPVLRDEKQIGRAIETLESAYATALSKAETLEVLYEKLPASSARPAVAAALADVDPDTDRAFNRYERVRQELQAKGPHLAEDGLDIAAVAALLLLNRDEESVPEFLAAYRRNRSEDLSASESVEYALAGLSNPRRVAAVREQSKRLGLPVAITAALLERRSDGAEVFHTLLDELVESGVTGDTSRTVAGILAISLEPAQALRRWTEARAELATLGLEGSYADIAAAFGASDSRGPREFALAYAAQRQALARSSIDDADRFAPELAHAGTSRQTDTWTGEPISNRFGSFDPFTLLYYHWVVTGGQSGSYGWEAIDTDSSWSSDSNSWFGGFSGGGFGGGSGGSSSWGGGGWSSGSFGG